MTMTNDPPAPVGQQSVGFSTVPDTVSDIVDVTMQSFVADVVETSQNQLVLLDLWAPWCGPCKQLTPLLERLVGQTNGAVRLARMNIDAHPAVAQQLRVKSIPAVFAFKGGQPVDGFMGALPESQIKAFIDKHLDGVLDPSPIETLMEAAREADASGDLALVAQSYGDLLTQMPDHLPAIAGLAQCHLAVENIEAAEQTLALAPTDSSDPDIMAARAALALAKKVAEKSASSGDVELLLAALQADPNNYQARFDLALIHHAAGRRAEAIATLLEIVAAKRDWHDGAARKQLIEFFTAYGADDGVVIAGRRQLSSLLFS